MIHSRPALPVGHGEVVEQPPFESWASLAEDNRAAASGWTFLVAGVPAERFRADVRRDVLAAAGSFSARLGVEVRPAGDAGAPIVMTGHQPDLYHPGVWVKDFLLERLALETGATAVDVMVDSDGFDTVSVTAPCMTPGVARCRQYLALGGPHASYAFTPVPGARDLDDFCAAADSMLASLPAPAVRRHFSEFCGHLRSAASDADNLAELVTLARRRYEASAGTGYLEAPITAIARTRGWARFVADLALSAERFSADYNADLAEYRRIARVRSAAQPFPDLAREPHRFELPLWRVDRAGRRPVFAEPLAGGGARLADEAGVIAELPADPEAAIDALLASPAVVAPKAVALTLFLRLFASDLFIHGIGGGRYDRVTDGVIRRYYGVEPPAFVVASMTMYLPLGAHVVGPEEVSEAKERVNRLTHNPDTLLDEVDFDDPAERERAIALSAEKARLVAAIAQPDADRKTLGLRIKAVNAELAELLAPLREELEQRLELLEAQTAASEILTDRTYPFCFWDPREIADKVG